MAFNASVAAADLRTAMKGFGTDEAALIRIISHLRANDIKPLVDTYNREIKRDLITDIKSETSGNFEDALVAALTPTVTYDCELLRKAMKGIGTDEQVLIEVICTRTAPELRLIATEFKAMYNHDLEEDIRSETSGDLKRALVAKLKGTEEKAEVDADVEALYKAGQGRIGTDEAVFINILCYRSREHLDKLNVAYANKHNKSLAKVIDSEVSGDFKRALIAIVRPPAEFLEERLHAAMKGMGTDDKTVIRIVVSQRFRWLKHIAALYLKNHDVPLKKRVHDELSGDYRKLMVAIIEHIVEH